MADQNIITWNVPNILSVCLMAAVGGTVIAFTLSAIRGFRGASDDEGKKNA